MSDSSLAPTLLLAMPQMMDPNFSRSVVLLCKHERDGAMGLDIIIPGGHAADAHCSARARATVCA